MQATNGALLQYIVNMATQRLAKVMSLPGISTETLQGIVDLTRTACKDLAEKHER